LASGRGIRPYRPATATAPARQARARSSGPAPTTVTPADAKAVDANLKINRRLWELAENYANN
jgi:hypothetical protein